MYPSFVLFLCLASKYGLYTTSVSQDLPDVTSSQAASDSFTPALEETISELLGEPVTVVTDVTVTAERRMMLSGVRVSYIVTVTSGQTTEHLSALLHASESSGTFASILSVKLGYLISKTSIYAVYDLSTTASRKGSNFQMNQVRHYQFIRRRRNLKPYCAFSRISI